MNDGLLDRVVKAVLYEGYLLYPYRPSALKNRQRFNFGVLYPRTYSDAQGGTDAWQMQTECLVAGSEQTQCRVRVRFLRMVDRSFRKLLTRGRQISAVIPANMESVNKLEADGERVPGWQEAAEETVEVDSFRVEALAGQPMQRLFRLPDGQDRQTVRDESGLITGLILRNKAALAGTIRVGTVAIKPGLFKLTVQISNDCVTPPGPTETREEALTQSLVSTHTILEVCTGEFISLIDPPEPYREFAAGCNNVGTWPVLIGKDGERDTMLSSPIILYDYPQIAPESPGDLFDGAEIDEILSLRILTLTEEEKAELRRSDGRAREILERTESLPEEHFRKLHGALRGMRRGNDRG